LSDTSASVADYLTQLFNVRGKAALLTGAGGYLVGTMARGLAQAGVKLALYDANPDSASVIAAEVVAMSGVALAGSLDVRDRNAWTSALDTAVQRFGRVDFLINGAGANAPTPFLDIAREEWDDILAVQLTGTMLGCQVVGRHMIDRGGGAILNISSASSGPPLSKAFTYSVAKAGVKNLTQNLAREWAPHGVRVNALRPGFFPTEWSKQHFITPEREAAILGHTPMKRYGRPEELVGAVVWLLSDAASFVTGAEIAVDGGFTAMTI
jgi:NAD(P)-dependent dehydrogenase (short-subunit alcohol dehydrogenase family)